MIFITLRSFGQTKQKGLVRLAAISTRPEGLLKQMLAIEMCTHYTLVNSSSSRLGSFACRVVGVDPPRRGSVFDVLDL